MTSHPVRVTRRTDTPIARRPGAPAGTGVVVIAGVGRSVACDGAPAEGRQHEVRVDRGRERADAVGEPRSRAG